MFIVPFSLISSTDLASVGGKNASLGEMFNKLSPLGIEIPNGFAVNAAAYRNFLAENKLETPLQDCLNELNTTTLENLPLVAKNCRELISGASIPTALKTEIIDAYTAFAANKGEGFSVAVRSSATAEDLPTASFAGQHDSFLNIRTADEVLEAVKACYVSLFNDRAIKYRIDNGFNHMQVYLSVGIQKMVRADIGCAGVAFTLEPESGFRNVVYITGCWGLGENVVQGAVNPDEFIVFKPTLKAGCDAIIKRKLGEKQKTMTYAVDKGLSKTTLNVETTGGKRKQYIINNSEVHQLAKWCVSIEDYYHQPMDIEWAKDGIDGKIYIVQARPETVVSQKKGAEIREFKLKTEAKPLCTGKSVGKTIVSGPARIITSLNDAGKVRKGDILVADITNPDWNALLKKAVSIVTNKGGRTSHASIVARELGIPAVVGTQNATRVIKDGEIITVSCIEAETGKVYDGLLEWNEKTIHLDTIPATETAPMLILANPDKAFGLSFYPAKGVGLLRMEFIISNSIMIHPMACIKFDELPDNADKSRIVELTDGYSNKREYFIDKLARSVGQVAAAFYPNDVIVRMSDFKTNEYASLLGGKTFEPVEENPMLGFRGASRYYNDRYREGFQLECEAMKYVRQNMGLSNVKLMIPFCRTVEEGKKVIDLMSEYGLKRGENGLEIYVMVEIPSNVILAQEFARLFDGFSIGSNDLTQLTLGIDRDSTLVSNLFNERNDAAKWMIKRAIKEAKKAGVKIGLCGQAASDYPEFTQFLVEEGIDSISFNADALVKGIENISAAEKKRLTVTIE